MGIRIFLFLSIFVFICQQTYAVQQDFYDEGTLRTLQLEFSDRSWWSRLRASSDTDENVVGTLIVDGVTYEGVGVRIRGMTSDMMTEGSQKKSFNIEIDYTVEDQRLMGYKTLNLINSYDDPTFMREMLYSNTCRRQIPSARANFVLLEINGENWGVYGNVQQLDSEFIEDWFDSYDGTRWQASGGGGNFGGGNNQPGGRRMTEMANEPVVTEPGGGGGFGDGRSALTWLGSDPASYEAEYELKNTKLDDPWTSLIETCDVLNNTPLADLSGNLESVLNVDRALWLCAFEIIFHDDDGYIFKRGGDYGIYYDPETGQVHVLQYDGNTCMKWDNAGGWSLFYREDDSSVPLMYRLMKVNQYRQRYLAHARTILDSFLTEEELFPKIDAYEALIEEEVMRDDKKLYSNQAFVNGVDELKEFVQRRRDSLLSQKELNQASPEIIAVNQEVTQSNVGQSLTITAQLGDSVPVSSVDLYFALSLFGRFGMVPMLDDGRHGDGEALDGVFGIVLPEYPAGTVLRYYIQATADDSAGTLTFNPAGAEYVVYTHVVTYAPADSSPVVINELMALNENTIADPQGEYDDWIELVNVTNETVDLSDMYLSDNPENPLKWQFPEDTKIEPGEYLLVWADEDGQDEPGLHANFKLSSDGETIWFYDTDERGNALLDSASFEALGTDESFGRYPDGQGPMQVLSAPTPLSPNIEPAF
jgi:hypothetical protein